MSNNHVNNCSDVRPLSASRGFNRRAMNAAWEPDKSWHMRSEQNSYETK